MWATACEVKETSGEAYQSDWNKKEDAIDRVKWRNGVYKLSRSTR